MTLSELWGLGMRQNPNVGRILLSVLVTAALALLPCILFRIKKRKIWLIVAFVTHMLMILGMAALSILLCANEAEARNWLSNAGIYLIIFPIHVRFLRWMDDINASEGRVERELDLYTKLINGCVINMAEEANNYGVSERCIQRDIEDIRNFMDESVADSGVVNSVIYDCTQKEYRLERMNAAAEIQQQRNSCNL